MEKIKPFRSIRPSKQLAEKVAVYSNNILNDEERRERLKKNAYSFAHIVKPKLDFDESDSKTTKELFEYSAKYFEKLLKEETLIQENKECFYVYRQILNGRSQAGVVCCYHVDEYLNGNIKKHENTREEKEIENVEHLRATKIQGNPIFLAYKPINEIDNLVNEVMASEPVYHFTSEYDVLQSLWVVSDDSMIKKFSDLFNQKMDVSYIADGHHRAASTALYAAERKKQNKFHNGTEAYNYLFTCLFPSNQLKIFEYNRTVKDLNRLSKKNFLAEVEEKFSIRKVDSKNFSPSGFHEIGMYLDDEWYLLKPKTGTFKNDPVEILDVSILQQNILNPILGIKDPRTDKRIDFIAGTKGISFLEKKVNKKKCEVAFALYPASMQQMFDIADASEVMPPKSTWFEPKLLSGLVIYKMD